MRTTRRPASATPAAIITGKRAPSAVPPRRPASIGPTMKPRLEAAAEAAEGARATLAVADVGDDRVGDCDVAARQAVEDAREKQSEQGHGHETERRREQRGGRQGQGEKKDQPRDQRAGLCDRQHGSASDLIRPAPEAWRAEHLRRRVHGAQDAVGQCVAAEVSYHEHQKGQHETQAERSDEMDHQDGQECAVRRHRGTPESGRVQTARVLARRLRKSRTPAKPRTPSSSIHWSSAAPG